MRRAALLTALVGVAALAGVGCGAGDERAAGQDPPRPAAFFGWVLGTAQPTGVAIDADPITAGRTRRIRASVCDGLGPPRGKAIWFTGNVDVDRANRLRRGVTLRSASRRERLLIDHIDDHVVRGAFIDRSGRRRQFVASPATGGAGIYEVSLSRDLRYTGTSTRGDQLTAQAQRSGAVRGEIRTAEGASISFRIHTLSLAPVADLERRASPARTAGTGGAACSQASTSR